MKCKVVRRNLLVSTRPARPPAAVIDHLARCAACRDLQRQLVRLERLVPELPVPASSAKADCLHSVLHSDAYGRDGKGEVEWRRRERALRKVAITFALAAGLLFFALIWYAWQHNRETQLAGNLHRPRETRLEQIVNHYDRGALAVGNPRERVERLAAVAQRLQGEAKERAQTGTIGQVTDLARQFEVLVHDGILAHALNVPTEERADVLSSIAEQLSRAESEANQLANQHPTVREPLQSMAVAALNGHLKLRELAKGKV